MGKIEKTANPHRNAPYQRKERRQIYSLARIDMPSQGISRRRSNSTKPPADLNLEIPTTRDTGSSNQIFDPRLGRNAWNNRSFNGTPNSKASPNGTSFKHRGAVIKVPQCELHEVIMEGRAFEQFKTFCCEFRARNPAQNVGSNCTKGLDQVGFFICRFLAATKNWEFEAAVAAVRKAREPGICDRQCVDTLYAKYGVFDERILAVPTPDRPMLDGVRYRANILLKQIPGVSAVADPSKVEWIRSFASQLSGHSGEGYPGKQPVRLGENHLSRLKASRYRVTWKSDGVKCLMLIINPGEIYLLSEHNDAFKVSGFCFPFRGDVHRQLFTTLLDGEMVFDRFGGRTIPRFLVRDVVQYRLDETKLMDLNMREICVREEIIGARTIAAKKGTLRFDMEPFSIEKKDSFPIKMTANILSPKFKTKIPHRIEGLIFEPIYKPYMTGVCDATFEIPLDGTTTKLKDLLLKTINEESAKKLEKTTSTETSKPSTAPIVNSKPSLVRITF